MGAIDEGAGFRAPQVSQVFRSRELFAVAKNRGALPEGRVAAANGNELASENTQIYAKRLDKSDLRKAQKLSRRCLKKPASCPKYSY